MARVPPIHRMPAHPTCLRCGKHLRKYEERTSTNKKINKINKINKITQRWANLKTFTILGCPNCRAIWLYSKSLNCPIMLKEKMRGKRREEK